MKNDSEQSLVSLNLVKILLKIGVCLHLFINTCIFWDFLEDDGGEIRKIIP